MGLGVGSVASNWLGLFWCLSVAGESAFLSQKGHNFAQIQVGRLSDQRSGVF